MTTTESVIGFVLCAIEFLRKNASFELITTISSFLDDTVSFLLRFM